MRVWAPIFNVFAVLLIGYMLLVFLKIDEVNKRQFEELRLKYAVDYAVEAAFRTTVSVEDIGIDYADIDNVRVNPNLVMETFKSLICLSYDMAMSKENFAHIESAIPTGVLMANDGYYILEAVKEDLTQGPYDGTPNSVGDGIDGGDIVLRWSVKKPYLIDSNPANPTNGYLYAANIYNETWTRVNKDVTQPMLIEEGKEFSEAGAGHLDRDKIQVNMSKLVTDDINYQIYLRNTMYASLLSGSNNVVGKYGNMPNFYLPSGDSLTAINSIKRPTLMMFMQGVDFANGQSIDVVGLGGARTVRKRQIAGFIKGGIRYYCYEKQLPEAEYGLVQEFFPTMEKAAEDGYRPHMEYLTKPVPRE